MAKGAAGEGGWLKDAGRDRERRMSGVDPKRTSAANLLLSPTEVRSMALACACPASEK